MFVSTEIRMGRHVQVQTSVNTSQHFPFPSILHIRYFMYIALLDLLLAPKCVKLHKVKLCVHFCRDVNTCNAPIQKISTFE